MHSSSAGEDVTQDHPPKSVGMHCGTQCEEHRGMSQADFTLITRLCTTWWISIGSIQFATLSVADELLLDETLLHFSLQTSFHVLVFLVKGI